MSSTVINPGKPTMAHAIERYFNVALYLLVLTGFVTLASTGGLDLPGVVLVGLALLLRGYQLAARLEFAIPDSWTNYLTLLYIFVGFADYFFVSRSFLAASVHLVLFLMVLRLFSLQRPRDHYMLAVLSFLMVLGASVLTVDAVFLFSFAGFMLVAVITFVLMEMRHSLAEEHARAQEPRIASPYGRMAYVLAATAPLLVHDDYGRELSDLLSSAPGLFALPQCLHFDERFIDRLHRPRTVGPHRADPAIERGGDAHRDPE